MTIWMHGRLIRCTLAVFCCNWFEWLVLIWLNSGCQLDWRIELFDPAGYCWGAIVCNGRRFLGLHRAYCITAGSRFGLPKPAGWIHLSDIWSPRACPNAIHRNDLFGDYLLRHEVYYTHSDDRVKYQDSRLSCTLVFSWVTVRHIDHTYLPTWVNRTYAGKYQHCQTGHDRVAVFLSGLGDWASASEKDTYWTHPVYHHEIWSQTKM